MQVPWPVSYTHLDVYKRQLQGSDQALGGHVAGAAAPGAHGGLHNVSTCLNALQQGHGSQNGGVVAVDIDRDGPVSYTHLDVYKRQGFASAGTDFDGKNAANKDLFGGGSGAGVNICLLYTSYATIVTVI